MSDQTNTCEHGIPLECECTPCDEYDNEMLKIRCSRCGKPTRFDPVYGDLCFRCCRAENE